MSDLTLTRDIDGMLEWEWTDPPCRTYEVGHDVLSDLVDDHNALRERVATLEDGIRAHRDADEYDCGDRYCSNGTKTDKDLWSLLDEEADR